VLFTVAVTFFIYSLVDVVDYAIIHITAKTETKMDDMMAPMVRKSLRVVIVVLALVQIATILSDKPVTSILAGLGVGGLAVALAAQETIKNFFGSLVIFADKPFELGERIKVGGHEGSIEEVGFRSTRIRTLEGHLVTVPNGELANMMIQNVSKRPYIKRVMNVTITYDTSPEKVQEALDILRALLDNHEGMNADFPPRVFFSDFNDCSLNILAIYWYHPPDYWKYLEHANGLNMELLKQYNEAGIEFAFPTQTLYVNGLEGALNSQV
jgi:MscS family membrane protein